MNNRPIIPHLWFDTEAVEAANFYATVFPNSSVTHVQKLSGTPSGDTDIVSFDLNGQPFMAISAGPVFKINPSISFLVNYDPSRVENAKEQIDAAWAKLSEGGVALMPLQEYPFSKWYGWIQDRYGVSWQLMLTNPDGEPRPFITPAMMFTGANAGRAEEAEDFYCSVFEDGKIGTRARYPEGPDEGKLMYSDFYIRNSWLAAMDSSLDHKFNFNEAVSLLVQCDTQEEIDEYWSKLSAVPEAEQCGWLKDTFGVSWQISPIMMETMMSEGTPEQTERVVKAFMQMKKFDLAALQAAYDGA